MINKREKKERLPTWKKVSMIEPTNEVVREDVSFLTKKRGASLNSYRKKQCWGNKANVAPQMLPGKGKYENTQFLGYVSCTLDFSDSTYTNLPLKTPNTAVLRTCQGYSGNVKTKLSL